MKVALSSDHRGFGAKSKLKAVLTKANHSIHDFGCDSSKSCDYPDLAIPAAQGVSSGEFDTAILFCGTGIGMSITANKLARVRAALCHSVETARLSRQHNDSNVLAIGARVLETDLALAIVAEWLKTDFDGGRHQERLEKIKLLEDKGVTKVE